MEETTVTETTTDDSVAWKIATYTAVFALSAVAASKGVRFVRGKLSVRKANTTEITELND